MKTAISVEDGLLQEADRTAKHMGVSRSRLFSLAVQDFLRERRQREVLDQLNRAYDGQPDPLATKLKTKFRTALQDKW